MLIFATVVGWWWIENRMPTLWVSHVQVDRGIIGLKILSFRRDGMIGSSKSFVL